MSAEREAVMTYQMKPPPPTTRRMLEELSPSHYDNNHDGPVKIQGDHGTALGF